MQESIPEQVDALFEASDAVLHALFARMIVEPDALDKEPPLSLTEAA